ncbi:MAG: GNAT family N-acetyltransferase [Acidobacteria bacterium]|nr:GNAT family N-acetyltransferase [Acidobacteriota bacterium]
MIELINAENPHEIEDARTLFREYEQWLGLDLCFQGFEAELATLPGKYARPDGRLILAYREGELAGSIALRKLEEGICEMKRLFLRENARGHGIGHALIEHIVGEARDIGYRKMRLDTYPPKMGKAVALYQAHGFYEIPAYYETPYDDILYLEKAL